MIADAPAHGQEYHDLDRDYDKYYTGDPNSRDIKNLI
jgi:hypothetical protein